MTARGASGLDGSLSTVAGVAWPPLATGFGAVLAALLRQLETSEYADPDAIAAGQRAQLAILAEHCGKYSRQFKARLAAAKLKPRDLGEAGALDALIPLRRRDLQVPASKLYCTEVPQPHLPLTQNYTSGSTGEPVVTRQTNVTQLFFQAMAMRDHLWHGRDFRRRAAEMRSVPGDKNARLDDWGVPVNTLYRSGPSLGIPSRTPFKSVLATLAEFQPDNLLIYPNLLGGLVDYCGAHGVAPPTIPHLRTTGETLSPELREAAAGLFRGKVEDCYSSQELGYIAIECPVSGLYHVMAENLIVEVLDARGKPCREGETGRLVITHLHNFATPLIRYDIGDYAEVAGPCACGRTLPTLKRIVGRERNLVLMPDGSRKWPFTGYRRFRDHAPVRQFQFVQLDRRTIEVRLVVDAPLTPEQEAGLRGVIERSIGPPFEIRFAFFDDRLPVGANGKFEDFLCLATADMT